MWQFTFLPIFVLEYVLFYFSVSESMAGFLAAEQLSGQSVSESRIQQAIDEAQVQQQLLNTRNSASKGENPVPQLECKRIYMYLG